MSGKDTGTSRLQIIINLVWFGVATLGILILSVWHIRHLKMLEFDTLLQQWHENNPTLTFSEIGRMQLFDSFRLKLKEKLKQIIKKSSQSTSDDNDNDDNRERKKK